VRLPGKVDSKTRRALRASFGTRTSRKNGIKSHGRPKPKELLAQAIVKRLTQTRSTSHG
jgi:hypothetical protein